MKVGASSTESSSPKKKKGHHCKINIHSSLRPESKMTYRCCGDYKGSRCTKAIYYYLSGPIDMFENKSGIICSLFLRVSMRLSTIYG